MSKEIENPAITGEAPGGTPERLLCVPSIKGMESTLPEVWERGRVASGHVPQVGVTVHHPYQLLAGSLQQHLLA